MCPRCGKLSLVFDLSDYTTCENCGAIWSIPDDPDVPFTLVGDKE